MEQEKKGPIEIPTGGADTKRGKAYLPTPGFQVLLIPLFIASPFGVYQALQAWLGLSLSPAVTPYCALYVALAGAGYYLWCWMTVAASLGKTGVSLLQFGFRKWRERKNPTAAVKWAHTEEESLEMLALVQRGSFIFSWLGWIGGLLSSIIAIFLNAPDQFEYVGLTLVAGIVSWGYFLRWLGRHGFLDPLLPLHVMAVTEERTEEENRRPYFVKKKSN